MQNRGAVWAYISEDAGKHFLSIHRLAQHIVDTMPFRRLYTEVDCDFKNGHRWMKLLGFTCEAERMRACSPIGGDCALYAKVNLKAPK
jgi:hypothetical protein